MGGLMTVNGVFWQTKEALFLHHDLTDGQYRHVTAQGGLPNVGQHEYQQKLYTRLHRYGPLSNNYDNDLTDQQYLQESHWLTNKSGLSIIGHRQETNWQTKEAYQMEDSTDINRSCTLV